uniref:Daam2 protein n=1 Tax=Mus musculus TaxID=10090 RepID=A1L328_MOUSE|nr:Daam2 protein [Mus musculus]
MGRLCTLDESVSLAIMIERIKTHLKLSHLRLALGVGRTLGKYLSSSGRYTVTLDKFWFYLFLTPDLTEHRMASNSCSLCFCL